MEAPPDLDFDVRFLSFFSLVCCMLLFKVFFMFATGIRVVHGAICGLFFFLLLLCAGPLWRIPTLVQSPPAVSFCWGGGDLNSFVVCCVVRRSSLARFLLRILSASACR
jgi:hypothetical protein